MTNTACSGYSHAASAEPLPSGNIRKIALWQRSGSWALQLKGQTAAQKCISTQRDSGEELRDAPPDLRFFFFSIISNPMNGKEQAVRRPGVL